MIYDGIFCADVDMYIYVERNKRKKMETRGELKLIDPFEP